MQLSAPSGTSLAASKAVSPQLAAIDGGAVVLLQP
jgi:hypothetical protein